MAISSTLQLHLIDEVCRLLAGAKIPHWLFGGWSVDFLLGSITRPHGDIEFFIWEADGPRAAPVMEGAGYALVDHPHPDEASIWRKEGQIVELYYIAVDEMGAVNGRGRWDNWPLPSHSLPNEMRTLEGVQCSVVSVECILRTKVEYLEHTGLPPREWDLADIEALLRIVDK